ncbi:MAG: thioredoxin domain-containing protein [Candidatus Thorarchaeota archaeon]
MTKPNRLVDEKSPYLLQHAYNPVDWRPWGEKAFRKAEAEDKPVFLSIGYSTCHWCHVMEHESFEDPEVARLMNDAFVSIKVDREERPDIDKIYMQVAQMMTGRGGWPLTIIMTPDKEPFFAGTYIPKGDRFGQAGMLSMIPQITDVWKSDRSRVDKITEQIKHSLTVPETLEHAELGRESIEQMVSVQANRFDEMNGGFGRAPKFPTPHNLMMLLRHWKRTGDEFSLLMVEKTLQKMRDGGIFDHVGYGFHRYATDARWLLPHFEKMLYDQAMLAIVYAETYQATGNSQYANVAKEILTYVMRDMRSPDGAFYSAEDADSEGEEGKFYVWSDEEIRSLLTDAEAEAFVKAFNIQKDGNFYDEATREKVSTNIPHVTSSLNDAARALKTDEGTLSKLLERAREKLFSAREKRVRPLRDDKVLTDWNGLMIAALAKAARILNEPEYAQNAELAVQFILKTMRRDDGILMHRFREDEVSVPAFLDDHAFLVWGLLELYETTFDVQYLKTAKELNQDMLDHFWDEKDGALFFAGDYSEKLLVRQKEAYDGAIPSGNSIAMLNLIRLARLLGEADYEQKASEIAKAFSMQVERSPTGFGMMLLALDFALGPSYEIIIAGNPEADDTQEMLKTLRERFIPNKIVILRGGEEQSQQITQLAPYTRYYDSLKGKATVHVCINQNCKLPTIETSQMLKLLDEAE